MFFQLRFFQKPSRQIDLIQRFLIEPVLFRTAPAANRSIAQPSQSPVTMHDSFAAQPIRIQPNRRIAAATGDCDYEEAAAHQDYNQSNYLGHGHHPIVLIPFEEFVGRTPTSVQ